MKIISGSLRGCIIPTVKNAKYRPSTGKFKEAIFSILTSSYGLQDKIVLDLFAGTGSFGFEAISRGAKHATFVDIDSTHLNTAKSFAEKHHIIDQTQFIRADSTNLISTNLKYDIIFVDPPYAKNIVEKALASLHKAQWLNEDAVIVIEVGAREEVDLPDWCSVVEERVYGGSKMIIVRWRREGDSNP